MPVGSGSRILQVVLRSFCSHVIYGLWIVPLGAVIVPLGLPVFKSFDQIHRKCCLSSLEVRPLGVARVPTGIAEMTSATATFLGGMLDSKRG
ncbi:hypothetical protein GQ54DRAFT_21206 [Martensiomyces pterosporus]|nr:hypothetical protein GQ54DRAFT_21206 [Martensiomyces pterosporus]